MNSLILVTILRVLRPWQLQICLNGVDFCDVFQKPFKGNWKALDPVISRITLEVPEKDVKVISILKLNMNDIGDNLRV